MDTGYNLATMDQSAQKLFERSLPKQNHQSVSTEPPISPAVWKRLVESSQQAVSAGWAEEGVFATGIGPEYRRGVPGSLLYVGKSAGPLGHAVGSCTDQASSGLASMQWMVGRKNLSAFWQFVDKFDRTRRRIAWTNICKMDRQGGERPPSDAEWSQVSEVCIAALADEISSLLPQVTVLATSAAYQSDVAVLLRQLGYAAVPVGFDDGWTTCLRCPEGRYAIQTKYPQGWASASRDRVVDLTMRLMSGESRRRCGPAKRPTHRDRGHLRLDAGRREPISLKESPTRSNLISGKSVIP
jgi:hypothetical protein